MGTTAKAKQSGDFFGSSTVYAVNAKCFPANALFSAEADFGFCLRHAGADHETCVRCAPRTPDPLRQGRGPCTPRKMHPHFPVL